MAVLVDSDDSESSSMSWRARSGHIAKDPNQDWRRMMRSVVTSVIVAGPFRPVVDPPYAICIDQPYGAGHMP